MRLHQKDRCLLWSLRLYIYLRLYIINLTRTCLVNQTLFIATLTYMLSLPHSAGDSRNYRKSPDLPRGTNNLPQFHRNISENNCGSIRLFPVFSPPKTNKSYVIYLTGCGYLVYFWLGIVSSVFQSRLTMNSNAS